MPVRGRHILAFEGQSEVRFFDSNLAIMKPTGINNWALMPIGHIGLPTGNDAAEVIVPPD
jgi:hypothetical protein